MEQLDKGTRNIHSQAYLDTTEQSTINHEARTDKEASLAQQRSLESLKRGHRRTKDWPMRRDYSQSLFSADFIQRNYPKAVAASVDFKSLKNNQLASGTTDR